MVICTVEVNEKAPQTIVIGRRGTYNTQEVVFDIGYLIDAYGAGTAVLAVKRSQDSSAYPAVVVQEDSTVTWTVSETDTYYKGAGECELMWYVDGGLAKTIIYPMVVMRDILSTTEEAPDAYQTWVDDLTALGAETLQNAHNAAQSASDAEDAKDDAVTAKEAAENAEEGAETAQGKAEDAQEAAEAAVTHYPKIEGGYWYVWQNGGWVNTGVKAEGLNGKGIVSVTGEKTSTVGNVDTYTMTVAYTSGNPDTFTFTVTNGTDGYSPVVTITEITGGHRVTITDETHPTGQSFDVMDGKDSAVLSVAGKTGAVTLNANDVAFSESGTYDEGTVGAELSNQKNAISQLEYGLGFSDDDFEIGNIDFSARPWNYSNSTTRVRTKQGVVYNLHAGDSIGLTDYTGVRYYIGKIINGVYSQDGWLYSDYAVQSDGQYAILIALRSETTPLTDKSELLSRLFIHRQDSINERVFTAENKIDTLEEETAETSTDVDNIANGLSIELVNHAGYIGDNGRIWDQTSSKEYYTDAIPVVNGAVYSIDFRYGNSHGCWFGYATYDRLDRFISRVILINASAKSYSGSIEINSDNVNFIRFTYRSFDDVERLWVKMQNQTTLMSNMLRLSNNNKKEWASGAVVKSINHRGYSIIAPENTLPAYILSKQMGFDIAECDVRYTSDGVPVLLHDESINRTARNQDGTALSSTINISDITYEQALQYDFGIWKGAAYAGTRIPTLSELFNLCRKIGLSVYVETKGVLSEELCAELIDIAKSCGMQKAVSWITYSPDTLNRIKTIDPYARLGLLEDGSTAPSDWLVNWGTTLKTATNEVFLDLPAYSDAACNKCKAAGLPLECWTINNAETILSMNPYVTGITSDSLIYAKVLYDSEITSEI